MEFTHIYTSGEDGQCLTIKNKKISNLTCLPEKLPELFQLTISGRISNRTLQIPMNFTSFKGLPKKLPLLKYIQVYDSSLPNLESLTAEMPRLKSIMFYNCHLHNFKGIPEKIQSFGLHDCTVDSFEGLEADYHDILNPKFNRLFLNNTTFSSLHGISRTTLYSILIEYFSKFGNFYTPTNFTPKGMELLNECINREIYDTYNPLEFVRRNLHHIAPSGEFERFSIDSYIEEQGVDFFINILDDHRIEYPSQNWNEDKSAGGYDMEDWVYALNLEEQLFLPDKIDHLLKFYEKSATELALQYRSDPKSLPKEQIQRLIHEADYQISSALSQYPKTLRL